MLTKLTPFQKKIRDMLKTADNLSIVLVAFLAIMYAYSFPTYRAAILVVFPVTAAGWFYGIYGGWAASVLALALNLYLVNAYQSKVTLYWLLANQDENFILMGHVFVFLIGMGIGALRKEMENRARTESALRTSEAQYRAIVENQTELICRATPNGAITFANQSYLNFFGKTLQEVIGRDISTRDCENNQSDMVKASVEKLCAEHPIVSFEEHFIFPNEKTYWVQWVLQEIIENGKALEIQSIGRDITARKQAEADLLEREMRLATIFDNSADAIITVDENQSILSFSKSAEKIFGYTESEIIGKSLTLLLPERIASEHHHHLHSFANAPESSRIKDKRRNIQGRRKNGAEFPAEASISKLKSKDKIIFAAFLRDMSEPLRKEKELQSQARFLSLLNEMTHSIIASTDFNTMMKTLAGDFANLLEADNCYITRCDEIKEQVFPVATTNPSKDFFMNLEYPKGQKNLTTTVLEAGRILVAENTPDTIYTTPQIIGQFPEKIFLSIPLIYGSHKLGAAFAGFIETREFTQEEITRAEQASNQIALAIWNIQQELELQRNLREAKALADIAQALSESERIGLNNVLDLIVNSAKDLIANAEQTVIHLLDEKERMLTSLAVAGFKDPEGGKRNMRLGSGIAGQVIISGETINIQDIRTDPRFLKLSDVEPTYRSLMVAPVRSGSQNLGTISIQSSVSYAFTLNDIKLISELGTQAAIAIENANLLESTQQALKEANALYRINQGLAASLDPDDLMQDTVELLQKNFNYYYVQIYVADPDTGDFIMRAGSGKIGMQLKARGHHLAAGEGIVGYTAETGTSFFTNDVDDIVSFVRNPLLPDTKSELAVPVKTGGNILGLLDIQQRPPKSLSQRDIQLVSAVADQLAIALQKADLYESLQISLQQEKAIRNQLMQNERLTVMGRLLATVSHELNNPLQAIQNALFLLKEETGISPQGKQDLNIVLAESERMASMIERLRDTYRPTQIDDFQPTQINDIIEDVYALISTHLRHNQIAFEFHPDPALPDIPALSDQIRQVVLNLLMNGVEAMSDGGKIRVTTELQKDADEILITISDNGPGIPPKILPTIFEAFVTSKASGTGLGLTISYDIVTKHRGRISAENNRGAGATFKIWLPTNNGEIL